MIESFISSGTGIGTSSTYGLKKSSPFVNGLGVTPNYALVSGSTRLDLVPFSLQNLTPFNAVYVEGASSISEIYPFSSWTGLRQFDVRLSNMENFSVTLPDKITHQVGALLYFYKNRKLTNFTPRYDNPELYNGYELNINSNNFLGTQTEPFGIDLSKKNYWRLTVRSNTNLYKLKISGNTLSRERNTLYIDIQRNSLLTDIIFDPPNSFSAMSVNTSGVCYTCSYINNETGGDYNDGDLQIFFNRRLSGLTSPLPDTSGIYYANMYSNNFIEYNSPFIHGNPVYLNLLDNNMTKIHHTFSGWPLSVAKKYTDQITGSSMNIVRGYIDGGLKFNIPEVGTKDNSIHLSGNVATITVGGDGRSVFFQLSSTDRRFQALYLQRNWSATNIYPDQAYPDWGFNDIGRPFTGFDFTCGENEPQDIQQFFGRYKIGLWAYNLVNGGFLNFSAFSSSYITPGTYIPTNGILYYPVDSFINLSDNLFTSLKDTNNNEVPILPNGLNKISLASNAQMLSFNTNLNRHLDYFNIQSATKLATWTGEVSGASRICYFNASYTNLSSWNKQFYTGKTQYGQIGRDFALKQLYMQTNSFYYLPELPAWMDGWMKSGFDLTNSIGGLSTFTNFYTPIHRFFTNADKRHIFNRVILLNNTKLTNLNLFLLYPFTHIYLNNTLLTNLTNFHENPNIKLIDLSDTKFTNSNNIIGNSNPWPSDLKYYIHSYNNVSSPGTLNTWTKSFSGLTSSTGYTNSDTDPLRPPGIAWNMDLNKQRLFLDFRGHKSLTGESGFDFIVRDLVTAKTFGTYLSGGVLMVSGVSASTSSRYEVDNVLSPWPTKNTGFTTINGSQFVVSNYGYMSDWLNLLTGSTIGETTGRGWITNIGRFFVFQGNWRISQLSNFPSPGNCNIVTNGMFTNDASSWIYNTSDWDWSSNNNGSMILTNGNNASLGATLLQNGIVNSLTNHKLALTLIIDSLWSGSLNISISMGGTDVYTYTFTTTGTHYLVEDVSSLDNSQGFLSIRYFNTGNANLIYLKDVVLCRKF